MFTLVFRFHLGPKDRCCSIISKFGSLLYWVNNGAAIGFKKHGVVKMGLNPWEMADDMNMTLWDEDTIFDF